MRLPVEVLDPSFPPVKLLSVSLAGRQSSYEHTCLARIDTAAKTLRWLDPCTGNEHINAERDEALGMLLEALCGVDAAGWLGTAWAQWDGWATEVGSGIPEQGDTSSCSLFVYRLADALAAGAPSMAPVPGALELRAQVAEELLLYGLEVPAAATSAG